MNFPKSIFPFLLFPFLMGCSADDTTLPRYDDQEQGDNETVPIDDSENGEGEESLLPSTDIGEHLVANDMEIRPLLDMAKPAYLKTVIDPSFGTTIRRISDAGEGKVIKPMYSTIQAWNADETLMILYDQSNGMHQLLDGMEYTFIRNLDDIHPDDIEQIFWHFDDPDLFYYVDRRTSDLIAYSVSNKSKKTLANFKALTGCSGNIGLGNDVQMMSWDSDVISFRCDNTSAYAYRISTDELTTFAIDDLNYIAPMPAASGERFYHDTDVYGHGGNPIAKLNQAKSEHACLGRLADGTDAHFAVAFAEGPQGGCIGNLIAHDLASGECFSVIGQDQGYDYPKSGTHISAVSHKNPGWVAASMIGYEQDGQALLDQELVLARVEKGKVEVYRIGHHRADKDEFDYWGEPHVVISPSATRVLFGSDWSGHEDGKSVDSYVVELPTFRR